MPYLGEGAGCEKQTRDSNAITTLVTTIASRILKCKVIQTSRLASTHDPQISVSESVHNDKPLESENDLQSRTS